MLHELVVRDLGVIAELSLVLGPGMTALTGETGAGKTLVVEAIELLVGGRADSVLVRPGATEARVDGRFVTGDDEVVLSRVLPSSGRSRAYVDGRPVPVGALAEAGIRLVDLHGQHAHQSLLGGAVQRAALDRFADVDLSPLTAARDALAAVDAALSGLGGDARARARELDLLRFQVDELDGAALDDPDEDAALDDEEARLADAVAHREAAVTAHDALVEDGGAGDAVAVALAAIAGRPPFAELEARLRAVAAEVGEAALDVRATGESIEDDPARLDDVRTRRQLLRELRRKYGDTLADVVSYREATRARLQELQSYEDRAAELDAQRRHAVAAIADAAAAVAAARRRAAPDLARAVEANLRTLAMPHASFVVEVGDRDPGDEVTMLLGANPGEPALPLAKVASGGELARAMLAARLVLSEAPDTLVFDEVDAGIGGEAAAAVGAALARLGRRHQVLVVTHLPQVAAWADHHVVVTKEASGGRTIATARPVDGEDRVVELSRMLSGSPDSESARVHAEELLAAAATSKSPKPSKGRA
jgi:DNA repair protein RecN (Recombination protein N)